MAAADLLAAEHKVLEAWVQTIIDRALTRCSEGKSSVLAGESMALVVAQCFAGTRVPAHRWSRHYRIVVVCRVVLALGGRVQWLLGRPKRYTGKSINTICYVIF